MFFPFPFVFFFLNHDKVNLENPKIDEIIFFIAIHMFILKKGASGSLPEVLYTYLSSRFVYI